MIKDSLRLKIPSAGIPEMTASAFRVAVKRRRKENKRTGIVALCCKWCLCMVGWVAGGGRDWSVTRGVGSVPGGGIANNKSAVPEEPCTFPNMQYMWLSSGDIYSCSKGLFLVFKGSAKAWVDYNLGGQNHLTQNKVEWRVIFREAVN
ncbi:hypothetical protein M9H77_27460 [Catharanthus roseus]|uniref:Uncharacterized protein n=1 Tax=Catharanthus roseus TaxID=4058 RepID=A0ACC0AF95_CATRO|nr:hypothetical protein M9H77_27460 [Catharanthus roseus]